MCTRDQVVQIERDDVAWEVALRDREISGCSAVEPTELEHVVRLQPVDAAGGGRDEVREARPAAEVIFDEAVDRARSGDPWHGPNVTFLHDDRDGSARN